MKKNRVFLEIFALLLTILLLVVGLYHLGCAMLPDRYEFGSVWDTYLDENKDTLDVLFLGSSIVYCDICPAEIYEQSGLTGFVMAGPGQTVPVSYAYLRECCKTQTPQVVFLDLTGLFFEQNPSNSNTNIAYMPFGSNRILAARSCENGILRTALFPLYEYHYAIIQDPENQTYEITGSKEESQLEAGYTPLTKVRPQDEIRTRECHALPGTEAYSNNLTAVNQIIDFCAKREISLILYFSPTMEQIPSALREQVQLDLSDTGYRIEDWTDLSDAIGIDPASDWFDSMHYNINGADTFTRFVASYLNQMQLDPIGAEDHVLWQERVAWWQKKTA